MTFISNLCRVCFTFECNLAARDILKHYITQSIRDRNGMGYYFIGIKSIENRWQIINSSSKNQDDNIYIISISAWSCNAALSRETRGLTDY